MDMTNLETNYLGIKLKNPIIVSSSGLTNSVDKIKQIETAGAGALVLKSLFEEQINHDIGALINESNDYPEAEDYIRSYTKSNSVSEYLQLIESAKAAVEIPVIASINCVSASDWIDYATKIEDAGADALELNIHVVSIDPNKESADYEQVYLDIVERIKDKLNIPIVAKIGSHFSNITNLANKLYHRNVNGVVLFNRFYQPDIDINTFCFVPAQIFSDAGDIRNSLRWVGIISDKVKGIDISASTGVHSGEAAIKFLLAGAQSVQICSVLYKNGIDYTTTIIKEIAEWMEKNNFKTIDDFRGKLSYSSISNPAIYERAQFMKHFSSYE